jgi:cytochrome c oxidase assembly factor CtaG
MNVRGEEKHIGKSMHLLLRVVTALLFICSVVGLIGIIAYGLFRIAEFDKSLYAWLYLIVAAILLVYGLFRLVRKGSFLPMMRRVSWIFIVIFVVCAIISAALLYGALFIRHPVIGVISAPPLIFCLVFFLPRSNLFRKLRDHFT